MKSPNIFSYIFRRCSWPKMSKRPHDAVDDVEAEPVVEEKPVKKHTLDSDEEDEIDNKKYNLMDPEEIEGIIFIWYMYFKM